MAESASTTTQAPHLLRRHADLSDTDAAGFQQPFDMSRYVSSRAQFRPMRIAGKRSLSRSRPKTSGGWRPISQFGIRRKTLQRLGADILQQRFPPEVFDFSCRGRGIEQASDRICELVVDEDCSHFAVFDLKDFYRSVQQEGLGEVTGLPVPLLRNCAYLHDKTPIRFHHDPSLSSSKEVMTSDVLGGAARQGISQGSPLSPDLERVLLGPVLRQVASPDRVVRYGDDGAIGARSHREAEELIIALNDELERHPLGPFRLKHAYIGWIDKGFEFLKYRYRRRWEGDVWRRPAYRCYKRVQRAGGLKTCDTRSSRASSVCRQLDAVLCVDGNQTPYLRHV